MSYVLVGSALALAAFLFVNVLSSLAVGALARRIASMVPAGRPLLLSRVTLALRLFPSLASFGFVAGLFVPSWALFEPRTTEESVGVMLGAAAAIAACLLFAGMARGWMALAATSRLVRDWTSHAAPLHLPASPMPAYRVDAAFPVFSTVGLFHPRMFVAGHVLDALTESETAAAVAHEAAHLRSRDNLKRLVLRSCPDVLAAFPVSRHLEESWARAAETLADARAAREGATVAVELASAIVKVARLTPVGMPMLPASALHDGGDVAPRVRDLLDRAFPSEIDDPSRRRGRVLLAVFLLGAALGLTPRLLPAVHHLTELAAGFLR